MQTKTIRHLHSLADKCILLSTKERPELLWLRAHHKQIQTAYQFKSKIDTDCFLYEKMYHRSPEPLHKLTKIRYWRTGQAVPGNREQLHLLADALELSEEDRTYFLQAYYDRSLTVSFARGENTPPEWQAKILRMKDIADSYLSRVSPKILAAMNIPPERVHHYLRHLYFADAFHYIHTKNAPEQLLQKHITSTRYDSEFTRQMKLFGEIPRKTMIRHLIILNMPDLTLEQLNQMLSFFGYLPLTEEHSMVHGERLDWLLIQLFGLYETQCASLSPEEKLDWFQHACQTLDAHFIRTHHPSLRFMHFKALDL